MKTKEVVIEGYVNIYNKFNEIDLKDRYIFFYSTKDKALTCFNPEYRAIKCKLILEIPEKEITITESEFNEKYANAAKEYEQNHFVYQINHSEMNKELKKQLFGE